jgi:arginyl-tRNA synthetase
MRKILNGIISAIIVSSIIISPTVAYAGDVMTAGTELSEDSYVFTIDEATELLRRVEELEAKEAELERYKELESLRLQQVDLYKVNINFYENQIERYTHLNGINQDLIDRYNKRDRLQTWENIGFLTLGIGLTIGAFLAADAITDHMEVTGGISTSF